MAEMARLRIDDRRRIAAEFIPPHFSAKPSHPILWASWWWDQLAAIPVQRRNTDSENSCRSLPCAYHISGP